MRALALLLICACQKDPSSAATGSSEGPPGPAHFDFETPKAARGDEVITTMRVQVTATEVYVNGERKLGYASSAGDWEPKMISERLAKALPAPNQPGIRVIVAADRHVEYGVLIAVLDAIQQRGYHAFALEAAP